MESHIHLYPERMWYKKIFSGVLQLQLFKPHVKVGEFIFKEMKFQ